MSEQIQIHRRHVRHESGRYERADEEVAAQAEEQEAAQAARAEAAEISTASCETEEKIVHACDATVDESLDTLEWSSDTEIFLEHERNFRAELEALLAHTALQQVA